MNEEMRKRLERLERLASEATQGHWQSAHGEVYSHDGQTIAYAQASMGRMTHTKAKANAAFIAAACSEVPDLLKAARERDAFEAELVFLREEYGVAPSEDLTRDALALKAKVLEAEVDKLKSREVELLRRALNAEVALEKTRASLKQMNEARQEWYVRYEKSQEEMMRWFKAATHREDQP